MDIEIFQTMLTRIETLLLDLEHERAMRTLSDNKNAERRVEVAEVFNLMSSMAGARTIDAIKAYRALTGAGLKESKDAVEAVMDRTPAP